MFLVFYVYVNHIVDYLKFDVLMFNRVINEANKKY